MAMKARDELESVDEPELRQIEPKPFRWDGVDPEKVVISYDRSSDTLLVHLFGRGRPSISVEIERYLYAMVDPDSEEIIGIHIEGFLSQAVKEHPRQIAILDYAELRGITAGEVQTLKRKARGLWRQLAAEVHAVLAHSEPNDKMHAIAVVLGPESTRWGIRGVPAA